jgi:hypothetical protein
LLGQDAAHSARRVQMQTSRHSSSRSRRADPMERDRSHGAAHRLLATAGSASFAMPLEILPDHPRAPVRRRG